MPCSGLGRSPTLPTPGSATTWRPGWSPRRTGTHRGRVETAQRPHARQLSSRAPSWPRTRPSTRHPDGCRGFRKPDAVPAPARRPPPPPRYWRSQPATRRGTRPTRSAAYPAGPPPPSPARSRSVDPAGGRHPHAAAASVAPGCRRGLLCVQRPVEGRDHDANHCDVQDQATSHRPQRRPPDSATAAVMECGACLSTACLHPAHRGVFHVEQAEMPAGPDEEPRRSMTDQGLTGT
jgi:hypothetical protein